MIHSILHVLWENHVDWAVGSLGGGLLSAVLIFLSFAAFSEQNYGKGCGLAVLELVSAILCCDSWRWALSVSGKTDAELLGIWGYPHLALFCYLILLMGFVCIAFNICGLVRKRAAQGRA